MNSPLAQLRSALAERGARSAPLRIFVRDDDVDEDEPSLRRLLRLFGDRGTPIILGVIPGRLTAAGSALLTRSVDAAPALIELNQHGWRHVNHEREGRKCEFGPSRTYEEQSRDIAQGKARMTEAFGPNWHPVFIPPWNRLTDDTCRALDRHGFRAVSAKREASPVTGCRFREVSVTLDLFRWKGGAQLRTPEDVVDELIPQLSRPGEIGVMLHHKVMDERAFEFLDALLETLLSDPAVQFHTFRSLLESQVRDDSPPRV